MDSRIVKIKSGIVEYGFAVSDGFTCIEACYPSPKKEDSKAMDGVLAAGGTEEIQRYDISEEWAHAGIVKAGDYCFLSYCVGNVGGTIEEQINGAFDQMERRLAMVGLTLDHDRSDRLCCRDDHLYLPAACSTPCAGRPEGKAGNLKELNTS